jgi:hypothetical protein
MAARLPTEADVPDESIKEEVQILEHLETS